jgi:hypothetical protein
MGLTPNQRPLDYKFKKIRPFSKKLGDYYANKATGLLATPNMEFYEELRDKNGLNKTKKPLIIKSFS